MRHNTVNDNETTLANETTAGRPGGPDLTQDALDNLLLRARLMRADATAQLLSRLGAAIIGLFRQRVPSNHAGSETAINREPRGAV